MDCVVKWMRRWKLRPNSAKTEIMCVVPNASSDVSHLQTFIFYFPYDPTPILKPLVTSTLALHLIANWTGSTIYRIWKSGQAHSSVFFMAISPPPQFHRNAARPFIIHVHTFCPYCCVVWCGAGNGLFAKLEIVHRRILQAMLCLPPETNIAVLYENCCIFPLKHYIDRFSCVYMHKIKLITAPQHVQHSFNWFNVSSTSRNSLRVAIAINNSISHSPVFLAYQL